MSVITINISYLLSLIIPIITLRIDKYGDIGHLLIQLSHMSVSADCKDYCSISRP